MLLVELKIAITGHVIEIFQRELLVYYRCADVDYTVS